MLTKSAICFTKIAEEYYKQDVMDIKYILEIHDIFVFENCWATSTGMKKNKKFKPFLFWGELDGKLDGKMDGKLYGKLDANCKGIVREMDEKLYGKMDGKLYGKLDGTWAQNIFCFWCTKEESDFVLLSLKDK